MNPELVVFLSLGLTLPLIILGFLKALRNDKLLIILLIVTGVLGVYGIVIRDSSMEMPGMNAADLLLSPFVYVFLYAALRQLYKKIFQVEPIYNRISMYDYEERRRQNWLDVVVHVLPMMVSLLMPLLIRELV